MRSIIVVRAYNCVGAPKNFFPISTNNEKVSSDDKYLRKYLQA